MGLDMYLSARKYIGGWKHNEDNEKMAFRHFLAGVGLEEKDVATGSPHVYVEVCVAYWRKANAVHAWFVETVQGGVDECQSSYVTREQLRELVGLCKAVLAGDEKPQSVLATKSGFFFGSTEYDEGYKADLEDTVSQLTPLIEDQKWDGYSFQYHASW